MRWDSLFDDLESQLEHELNAEDVDLRAEEHRLQLGRLSLRDRLMAMAADATDPPVIGMEMTTGEMLHVVPRTFGRDWFAADLLTPGGARAAAIVALDAVTGIVMPRGAATRGIPAKEWADAPRVTDRIGLPFALRDLCRRRSYVRLHSPMGIHGGTIDRVGRDHLDLAVHEAGTARREREVSHLRIVSFTAIAYVTMP